MTNNGYMKKNRHQQQEILKKMPIYYFFAKRCRVMLRLYV